MVSPIALAMIASLSVLSDPAYSKDCGTHGQTFVIKEPDALEGIQSKLKLLEKFGVLAKHQAHIQETFRKRVQRPKSVEGITRATETRTFFYDSTFILEKDIKDHKGNVLFAKGLRVNPFEKITLSQNLIFLDGDDEEQKTYVQNLLHDKNKPLKIILVKGEPLALAEEWSRAVYFDQGGILVKKLGIEHVPAVVSQVGMKLKIEEYCLDPERENEVFS